MHFAAPSTFSLPFCRRLHHRSRFILLFRIHDKFSAKRGKATTVLLEDIILQRISFWFWTLLDLSMPLIGFLWRYYGNLCAPLTRTHTSHEDITCSHVVKTTDHLQSVVSLVKLCGQLWPLICQRKIMLKP